eukprot:CAMPEP_0197025144 /NCGR_PEP_ID=MMETSP1384-20130603/5554_1 /TAXON_ID=29189 /ORGANISM="Ammonia sp." /LENGTH=390 /DNA_ID=CAMNT_0042453637 /DNA_START=32 /DNA_END=1204 /DNA_ORIENTATION=-
MAASNADRVLTLYLMKHGQMPEKPDQLVTFSRTNNEVPTIIYSEAKKSLNKLASSIKGGGKSSGNKYQVGDEVLISKDRTGILRYIGKVPEMGDDNIWYGLELTSGAMGQNDGSLKGKRYFQCLPKRGMFIPERKLRRRLNRKDKERRNSYADISNHVKQLQKDYAGDDAAFLYPSSQQPVRSTDGKNDESPNPMGNMANMHTLVFQNPEDAYKYGDATTQYQAMAQQQARHPYQPQQGDSSSPPNHANMNAKSSKHKKKKKAERQRSGSHGSSTSAGREKRHRRHYESEEDEDDDEESSSTESQVSDLDDHRNGDDDSSPTVKTFDTLLKYILRQKGQYREGLLDVYANPQTHPLIVEAFSQMKQLQGNEQAYLWPALLKRWSKYTHKI